MRFNKTTTLGEALGSWQNCESVEWKEFKASNGAKVVEFTCIHKGVKEYGEELKNLVSNIDYTGLAVLRCGFPCHSGRLLNAYPAYLDFSEYKQSFQFTLNKDKTFQLDNIQKTLTWSDGAISKTKIKEPGKHLEAIYGGQLDWNTKKINLSAILGYSSPGNDEVGELSLEAADKLATLIISEKLKLSNIEPDEVYIDLLMRRGLKNVYW